MNAMSCVYSVTAMIETMYSTTSVIIMGMSCALAVSQSHPCSYASVTSLMTCWMYISGIAAEIEEKIMHTIVTGTMTG